MKNTICAAFATISVDHLGVIGDTLEEIARTKSGIIKSGCAVVSARQTDVVRNVLKKKAEEKNCSYVEAEPKKMKILTDSYDGITFSYKEFEKMHSNLAGQCQRENLALSLIHISCQTIPPPRCIIPERGIKYLGYLYRYALLLFIFSSYNRHTDHNCCRCNCCQHIKHRSCFISCDCCHPVLQLIHRSFLVRVLSV